MDAALLEADSVDKPNYSAIADKHNVDRSTLSRQHRKKTRSREQFLSESCQLLSNNEELLLVKEIEYLGTKGLYPTPGMVVSLVQNYLKRSIGKNWIYSFLNKYSDKLTSVYLKGLDKSRFVAECTTNIEHFFINVSYFI
jgi:hypothetical protein